MIKKITIILILILITIFGVWFFMFSSSNTSDGVEGGTSIRDFFPFGRTTNNTDNQNTTGNQQPTNNSFTRSPILKQISEDPIAGATVFDLNNETFIRFVDRATGHVFEASTEFSDLQRLTNTTVPKIQEAVWLGRDRAVLRYLREDEETIESVLLKMFTSGSIDTENFEFTKDLKLGDINQDVLSLQKILNQDTETQIAESGVGSPGQETNYFGSKTEVAVKKFQIKYSILNEAEQPSGVVGEETRNKLNEITGVNRESNVDDENENLLDTTLTFLPVDIKQLVFLDKLQKIFFLQEDSLGTVGTLADTDGGNKTQIFQSDSKEWGIDSGPQDLIALFTKPNGSYPGIYYSLDSKGNLEKIIGEQNGLSAIFNNEDEKIVFSNATDNFILKITDVEQKTTFSFPEIRTLPEKCTWRTVNKNILYCAAPQLMSESYIDDWYAGNFSFSDSFWKLDTESGDFDSIDMDSGLEIDVLDPILSPNEKYLIFTNKKDYSLWSLKLFEDVVETEETTDSATSTETEI